MNEIKTIEGRGENPGDDYFCLAYIKTSDKYLKDFLPLFNIDDYFIVKYSGQQRVVSKEEFLEFKNCGYILFKKDKYDIKHYENWFYYLKNNIGNIAFLIKPLPPFSPEKIIIK